MRRRKQEFAKRYSACSLKDRATVLFFDETTIPQFYQRVIVRRPPGTRYLQRYVLKTVKHPISFMICGFISRNDRSQLKMYETGVHVNRERYERLLQERLQSEMLQHQADIFMHGNAPCHRASGDFFGGKYSGIGLARRQSRYQPHRKSMVQSEAESRANDLQGTRRSRKKNFISMGECYNTQILREVSYVSYVNARQSSRSNQKPRRSF